MFLVTSNFILFHFISFPFNLKTRTSPFTFSNAKREEEADAKEGEN